MNDNQILYIISFICLLLIIIGFKYSKVFALINLVIFIAYNLLLHFNMLNYGEGGSVFLWWFYLVILTLLQILIIICYLVFRKFHSAKSSWRSRIVGNVFWLCTPDRSDISTTIAQICNLCPQSWASNKEKWV